MPNNGMLLSPELHRMLTLTLAERLAIRARKDAGPMTRAKFLQIADDARLDAERAINEAVETLATLTQAEPVHAGKPSLAALIAAVK